MIIHIDTSNADDLAKARQVLDLFGDGAPAAPAKKRGRPPKKKEEPAPPPPEDTADDEAAALLGNGDDEAPAVTLEDVKAAAAAYAEKNGNPALVALFKTDIGVAKMSDLKEEQYADVVAKLKS